MEPRVDTSDMEESILDRLQFDWKDIVKINPELMKCVIPVLGVVAFLTVIVIGCLLGKCVVDFKDKKKELGVQKNVKKSKIKEGSSKNKVKMDIYSVQCVDESDGFDSKPRRCSESTCPNSDVPDHYEKVAIDESFNTSMSLTSYYSNDNVFLPSFENATSYYNREVRYNRENGNLDNSMDYQSCNGRSSGRTFKSIKSHKSHRSDMTRFYSPVSSMGSNNNVHRPHQVYGREDYVQWNPNDFDQQWTSSRKRRQNPNANRRTGILM